MLRVVSIWLSITLLIIFTIGDVNAAETARLFIAQKNDHIAFLLPITHKPSKLEKDPYLENVISEVARRSTSIYDESAWKFQIFDFALLPCKVTSQFSNKTIALLDPTFNYISRYDSHRFPAPEYLQEKEFAKLMIVLLGPVSLIDRALPDRFAPHETHVAAMLASHYGIKRQTIEGMQDFHRSYCSLTPDEREGAVKAAVAMFEGYKNSQNQDSSKRYEGWLRCIKISAFHSAPTHSTRSSSCSPSGRSKSRQSLDKFLLANRNSYWLNEIERVSETDAVPFYALGAEHFIENSAGDGLLRMLEKDGFQISLASSLKDIPSSIFERKAAMVIPNKDDSLKSNLPN
ncbi:hypothetical protein LP420_04165 [Massilia sp. B-10]|nr:hypothetical protein LP420_04165 [Massilia sp. B-10]